MTQAVYSEENFRVLLFYVILPLTVVLLLFFAGTKIYSALKKDKDINQTNYAINYWTNVLGILVTAILLSVSIASSPSITEREALSKASFSSCGLSEVSWEIVISLCLNTSILPIAIPGETPSPFFSIITSKTPCLFSTYHAT